MIRDREEIVDDLSGLVASLRDCGVGDGAAAAIIAERAIGLAEEALAAAREADRIVLATRKMANDSSARLRAVVLRALGQMDDGRSSLMDYVGQLVARRGGPAVDTSAVDAAMFSIWLHGSWRKLTQRMTTEEREAAASAVLRHDARMHEEGDCDLITDSAGSLRWWDR